MVISSGLIILWLSLSCILPYGLIVIYANLRFNYYNVHYDYSNWRAPAVRSDVPPPKFSWTEHHLVWIALFESFLHIAYWSLAYHVRETLEFYTFEMMILYSLMTFLPLLTSLQFVFCYLQK